MGPFDRWRSNPLIQKIIMRSTCLLASLALILSSSCAAQTFDRKSRPAPAIALCKPGTPGALVGRAPDAKTKPRGHTIIAPSFRFANATFVQGRCVGEIVLFNVGVVFLASREQLVVRENGTVDYHPHRRLPEKEEVSVGTFANLSGYKMFMAERIWGWPSEGERLHYIGLFRSRSDHVIARFDMVNGRASRKVEVLFRSKIPILAFDYLPFVDAPLGQIGFVQRVARDKAWLYRYDWHHGKLSPLAF